MTVALCSRYLDLFQRLEETQRREALERQRVDHPDTSASGPVEEKDVLTFTASKELTSILQPTERWPERVSGHVNRRLDHVPLSSLESRGSSLIFATPRQVDPATGRQGCCCSC